MLTSSILKFLEPCFLIAVLTALVSDVAPAAEPEPSEHWEITMGAVYDVNSFFCTSREGVDALMKARRMHHEHPSVPFRFPEHCRLGKFAFRPMEVTDIENSYYLAQRDLESTLECRNSRGKTYPCSFVRFTSRYVFGQLLVDRRVFDVYVEAPPSITVTLP